MATVVPRVGSLQPPPRGVHHLPSPQQHPKLQPPSAGTPAAPIGSAQMRALQLLRETQPRPLRRQSVPTALPPRRAPPPRPHADSAGAGLVNSLAPHARPILVGKPPPPTTPPPLNAAFGPGRRHSTGNFGSPVPLVTIRPPPPRGPPPTGGVGTAAATTALGSANTLLAVRGDLRRRSSNFRGPPPGPPLPGRRASSVELQASSGLPVRPVDSSRARPMQPQQQPLLAAAVPTGVKVQAQGTEEAALRRVSFSAYRGPLTDDSTRKENLSENNTQPDNGGQETKVVGSSEGEGTDPSIVSMSEAPLPQLEQRRRSSQTISGPGRPPPPRPPGDPPAGQIRRYSISNELPGSFSRRMSMINPVGESSDAAAAAGASVSMAGGDNSRRVSTGGNSSGSTLLSVGTERGEHAPPPSLSPEGRAAVLWYNMGVTRQKERDAKGAVECYDRAAKEGHAKARHNLAAIYEKGAPGVPKDEIEAVRLFQLAAGQGLGESCYSLAMHLKFGLAIKQDDAQCVYYLEKASEYGLAKAIFNLGLMYEKRRGVSPDAPEADLLEATRECYEAAAGAGVTKAMVNLGVLYLSGRLPGREQSEALEWFKKAADEEDLSGLWNLSLCYERGVGVARDTLAAQALQQQCRDRETEKQQQLVGSGVGASAAVGAQHTRRRSSEPSASATALTEEKDGPNTLGEKQTSTRRRSSSVPAVTPPPPEGSPPTQTTKPDLAQQKSPEGTEPEAPHATRGGNSRGYKYVPKGDQAAERRPSSSNPAVVYGGNERATAAAAGGATDISAPPSPGKRRDSLLLKPTPMAIARVKAAVERRKRLEAETVSASAAASALGEK